MTDFYIPQELIFLDVTPKKKDKKNAIRAISENIARQCNMNEKKLLKGFMGREKLSSTGFGSKFAIPHTKAEINQGIVAFFRFSDPIEWASMDGVPVENAIALVMPEKDENNEHLQMISTLARLLMHDEFTSQLNELTNSKDISVYLNKKIGEK